ncbi:helix-turn-helix domain-containing protein [Actinoallomurus rhizosphaericola]|uniref:helix-turn-helix domain-containing protein n=1 Tax=Actinoallomurus rhizosphaericola TaxID=2952536 RepID=UPI0020914367|nr:helix-turn-helix transcriptional regulator [Actinoallomurus rhizosphaericola]MCO5994505.1 helix-turn-helix domain-containing protein [Actinoallomurus rhizosphaericola]
MREYESAIMALPIASVGGFSIRLSLCCRVTTLGNGSGPTTPDSDSPEGDMGYRREVDPTTSVAALFAHKLRRYRDANGWTQDALADRVGCTGDLISKIETAKRSATTSMSEDFDRLFALDGYFAELQPLAARELALGWFRPFLEAEGTASSMHIFEPMLITGLLQNEDYARAVLSAGNHPDKVEQLVATRMERQQILRRDEPPWIVLLLAEYAIRRKVGGPEVMRAQLQRLLDAMKEPNITVQLLPEEAPVYLAMPFTIMGFEDRPDVAYAETSEIPSGITKEHRHVGKLKARFDLVRAAALSAMASEELIRSVLEDT